MVVGRIYSIQGRGGQKGEGTFSKFRGELAKRGELKKFRVVWTLDEAMNYALLTSHDKRIHGFLSACDFIEIGIVPIFHWLELINISGNGNQISKLLDREQ